MSGFWKKLSFSFFAVFTTLMPFSISGHSIVTNYSAASTLSAPISVFDDIVSKLTDRVADTVTFFFDYLSFVILYFSSVIVYVTGLVVNFILSNAYRITSATIASKDFGAIWAIVRDLVNLVIIASLIAIGISTIVRYSGFNIRSSLVQVLVVAVLVNFSLFFTKTLIDVSGGLANTFALEIEKEAKPKEGQPLGANFQEINSTIDRGLALTIINASGITALYTTNAKLVRESNASDDIKNDFARLTGAFFFLVFCLWLVWYLFKICWVIIKVLISLILLAVSSPIGFIPTKLPKLGRGAQIWWEKLICTLILLPAVFLILLLFAKLAPLVSKVIADPATDIVPGFITQIFTLIIVIMLLDVSFRVIKIIQQKCSMPGGGLIDKGLPLKILKSPLTARTKAYEMAGAAGRGMASAAGGARLAAVGARRGALGAARVVGSVAGGTVGGLKKLKRLGKTDVKAVPGKVKQATGKNWKRAREITSKSFGNAGRAFGRVQDEFKASKASSERKWGQGGTTTDPQKWKLLDKDEN